VRRHPSGARHRDSDIYVMNADGSGQRRLTNGWDCCVAWSPDGGQIAFLRDHLSTEAAIWVMNASGRGARRLARGRLGEPTWSSDGRHIAFDRDDAGPMGGIWVVDADGNRERQIVRSGGDYSTVAWSPKG
jgi:TolB protein